MHGGIEGGMICHRTDIVSEEPTPQTPLYVASRREIIMGKCAGSTTPKIQEVKSKRNN